MLRIGIDALAIQSPYSRGRGIGRYARSLLAAMLEQDKENHYIIYTYEDLSRDLIPTSPRVEFRNVRRRFHQREHTLQHAADRLIREDPDALDWYLLLSPFETWQFFGLPRRPLSSPRMAAVVYDLIPFLYQEVYLWVEDIGRWFYGHLQRLSRYDLLLAISEATARDTSRLLGLPEGRVVSIGSASDPELFYPGTVVGSSEESDPILERLGITRPFLFCLGSSDPRKNINGLLDAFARLSPLHRDSYQLVIACSLTEEEMLRVLDHAKRRGIGHELVLTNAITESNLRHLYQTCSAFVFPSLYEGFGLPILEAMQCGAPVIAANNSSQPEVVGDSGLLAIASDPSDLAQRIATLLDNPEHARQVGRKGLERSQRFSWETVAQNTLSAIKKESGTGRRRTFRIDGCRQAPKPRLAVFSPLAPRRSGISWYTERLCERLRHEFLIDYFHDPDYCPELTFATDDVATFDHRLFERRYASVGYANILYQFGNSTYHHFMYQDFLDYPGIVTLHDLAMAGFHAGLDLASNAYGSHLIAEAEYGEPGTGRVVETFLADFQIGQRELPEDLTRQGLLFNRRVLERARAVVVHSVECFNRITSLYPWLSHKVEVIRIAAEPRVTSPDERKIARDSFGLDPGCCVFGCFGILHPTKLNRETILAFSKLIKQFPDSHLVFVGRDLGHGEAEQEAHRLGLNDRIRFLGHLSDDEYEKALHAIDAGICLRQPPTNGESSASLLDLLRHGIATVVCRTGSFAELPDEVVLKIDWSPNAEFVDTVHQSMIKLASDASLRRKLGRGSIDYIKTEHSWNRFIEQYRNVCLPSAPLRRRDP